MVERSELSIGQAAVARHLGFSSLLFVVYAVDFAAVFIPGLVAQLIYLGNSLIDVRLDYVFVMLTAALLTIFTLRRADAYSRARLLSRRLSVGVLQFSWMFSCGVLLAAAFSLKLSDHFSRIWAVAWFVSTFICLPLGRIVIDAWVRRSGSAQHFSERVAIIGLADDTASLAERLTDQRGLRVTTRLEPTTFLASHADGDQQFEASPLLKSISEGELDHILIAVPRTEQDWVREVADILSVRSIPVSLLPNWPHLDFADYSAMSIAGMPTLRVLDRPMQGLNHVIKILEDRILGTLLFLIAMPVLVATAIAVKLTSKGPIFFQQDRQGFNDKGFMVWKFRTMYHEMEDKMVEQQAARNDPRVTPVGALLRRTSLDELPQLFNVVRGEMALVGPRPHAVSTKAAGLPFQEAVARYAARHRVKPGMTGWAQVKGHRGETDTIEKLKRRVEHDLWYIENWSLWLDIKILGMTVVAVVAGDNAI